MTPQDPKKFDPRKEPEKGWFPPAWFIWTLAGLITAFLFVLLLIALFPPL